MLVKHIMASITDQLGAKDLLFGLCCGYEISLCLYIVTRDVRQRYNLLDLTDEAFFPALNHSSPMK